MKLRLYLYPFPQHTHHPFSSLMAAILRGSGRYPRSQVRVERVSATVLSKQVVNGTAVKLSKNN